LVLIESGQRFAWPAIGLFVGKIAPHQKMMFEKSIVRDEC
jgi:hypothetical protein